jgi:hypothetical protein
VSTTTITFPLLDGPLAPLAGLPVGHSAPSERLINEAALVVYERWRRHLSHEEALHEAARFALRAHAVAARVHAADAMVSS